MKKVIFIIVIVCFFAGCGSSKNMERDNENVYRDAEIPKIREVVFEYIFKNYYDFEVDVYFLAIENDNDPDENLIKKMNELTSQIKKQVKKKSDADILRLDGVVDKLSGEKGVLHTINKIKWITKDKVEVQTSSYRDSLAGGSIIFSIEKINGKWTVVKAGLSAVS